MHVTKSHFLVTISWKTWEQRVMLPEMRFVFNYVLYLYAFSKCIRVIQWQDFRSITYNLITDKRKQIRVVNNVLQCEIGGEDSF